MRKSLAFMALCSGVFAQELQETKEIQEIVEKKEVKSPVTQILGNAEVSGFLFARYFYIGGARGNGQTQQYRGKIDITSGKLDGYSMKAGIFFSQGSSTPDLNSSTDNATQGSRAAAFIDNFSDRFSISQLYGQKEFSIDNTHFHIALGKMNMNTPLNDKNLDLATGALLHIKHKDMTYMAGFYDSFISDMASYNLRTLVSEGGRGQINAAGLSIGNNLSILGISYSKDINVRLFTLNAFRLFDFMMFGDADYTFNVGSGKLKLAAQIAMTKMNDNAILLTGSKATNFSIERANLASFRGIFNVNASYVINSYSMKLGFLGSFGDGYGVILDYKGDINTAGKVWNGNITAVYEGFGALGSGSFNNTSLYSLYASLDYGFKIPLKISLDIAYVFGNTNMPLLDVLDNQIFHSFASRGSQRFAHVSFVEITPNLTYKFNKHMEFSLFAATLLGEMQFFKTRAELRYKI